MGVVLGSPCGCVGNKEAWLRSLSKYIGYAALSHSYILRRESKKSANVEYFDSDTNAPRRPSSESSLINNTSSEKHSMTCACPAYSGRVVDRAIVRRNAV